MEIKSVQLIYFSPTGGTKKLASKFASFLADKLDTPVEETRINAPEARERVYSFGPEDLVVLAVPTFAGRVPNKIEPDLRKMFRLDESPAVALVSFGNRDCGTAPEELADILRGSGARVIGAGAFVCRHSFDVKIAKGRPDREDKKELESFADAMAEKVSAEGSPDEIETGEIGPYYKPLREDSEPAMFLKAKPLTREEDCYRCGLCVRMCPMGSIESDCVTVSGICIKCQACVHSCPTKAKYFDDPDFLSHVRMLGRDFVERAENKIFL